MRTPCPVKTPQGGFTYLAVLFAVVLMGVLLAGAGQVWHAAARREKEAELLFRGMQIRDAIISYRDKSPGGAREYPGRLEDLLADKRFPFPVRHLRRLYPDPMTRDGRWGLIRDGDRIAGVHSLSPERPLKQGGFPKGLENFEKREHYSDWQFSATDPAQPPSTAR